MSTTTDTRLRELEQTIARLEEEKRHYQWLAESTTDLISRHDQDGVFLYASQASQSLLGFAPEELVGICAYDMFHPDDLAALLSKSPSIYYHEGFYEQTYRFRTRAGHYIWFETTSRTRRDPATGDLIDILCVSRDVSRRVEEEARRQRLARVVESTTDYVLFCDEDETLVYSNQAARELLGLAKDSPSLAIRQLLTTQATQIWCQQVLPAIHQHGRWSGELALASPGGDIPVLSVVQQHREQAGHAQLSLVNRDLSLRLEAEAQARRHQEQITHANRLASLGELATTIAHECNQPLATLSNYASGALMQLERNPQQPASELTVPLTRISHQIQRLSDRLKHIRRFVRRGSLHLAPQDLTAIISAAVDLWEPQCRHEGVQLIWGMTPPGLYVTADAEGLEQVLVNLIRNALDACRDTVATTSPPRILVDAYPTGADTVCIDILDDGPGVPEDQRPQLFTPFVSSRPEGLGMGLSISLSLLEAMGGGLTLEDTGRDGATYRAPVPENSQRFQVSSPFTGARFRISLARV